MNAYAVVEQPAVAAVINTLLIISATQLVAG
jgi:hypothetical protein